jgi:hypothetical protein
MLTRKNYFSIDISKFYQLFVIIKRRKNKDLTTNTFKKTHKKYRKSKFSFSILSFTVFLMKACTQQKKVHRTLMK